MTSPLHGALQLARRCKSEGRLDDAERAYAQAAQLARSQHDAPSLAYALRHISELALCRHALAEAQENASAAVELYRTIDDPLGLANALRLQALSSANDEEATICWQEARTLYSALDVKAGVLECDSHLDG